MHVRIYDSQDKESCFSWKQTSTTHALWGTEYDILRSLSLSSEYWSSIISSSLLRLGKEIGNYFIIIDDDNPTLTLNILCFFPNKNLWILLSSYALSLSLSFHLCDDIDELFFMDVQFREWHWCQAKWHGSTFEFISSMSSLRIQVVTSSELRDRRIHEIEWSTTCRQRLS